MNAGSVEARHSQCTQGTEALRSNRLQSTRAHRHADPIENGDLDPRQKEEEPETEQRFDPCEIAHTQNVDADLDPNGGRPGHPRQPRASRRYSRQSRNDRVEIGDDIPPDRKKTQAEADTEAPRLEV